MIQSRNKKRILFAAALLALAAALCFAFAAVFAAGGAEQQPAVQEIYIGQVVQTPPRTLTDGEEEKEAQARIIAPDGGVYTGKQFTADAAGKWRVEYSAAFGGQTVTETQEYLCVLRPADLFAGGSAAEVENGTFSLDEEVKGLAVTFRSGGSVRFTQFADLTGKTKEDALLSFLVDPAEQGKTDLTVLEVTLTDAQDASNSITITIEDAGEKNCNGAGTFIRAALPGQAAVGKNGEEIRTGTGTEVKHSFRGYPESSPVNFLTLYWEDAENALYASVAWDYRSPSTTLVADFDDARFFPNTVWGGFSSGEVNISVAAKSFTSVSSKVLFTEIMGYDLTAEKYGDTEEPAVTVDLGGETSVPGGYIGAEYPVFAASAKDAFDGFVPVGVQVFYENSAQQRTDVQLTDGAFRIEYIGTYVIRYEASDAAGNTAFEEVRVAAVSAATPIALTVPAIVQSAQVYDTVALPPLGAVSAEGGSGTLHLTRSVTAPDGSEVRVAGDSFRPDAVGKYTVRYTAVDYVGAEKEYVHTIEVEASKAPVFVETPVLPKVLIEGLTYTLPSAVAKEAGTGGTLADVAVERYVNGEKCTGNTFTAAGTEMTIRYVAAGQTGSTPYEKTLPVVDADGGRKIENYFYGTFAVQAEGSFVSLTSAGEAEAVFANALARHEFELEFSVESYSAALKNAELHLSDSADPENAFTLRISFAESGAVTLACGDASLVLTAQGGMYSFTYTDADRRISDGHGSGSLTVAQTDAGQEFTGFSSAVWFGISAKESGTLRLSSLNNQGLSNRLAQWGDTIKPIVWFENSLSVKQELGAEIAVVAGEASDVLGGIASFTVEVTDPDGEVRVSGSAYESYTLTLDKYGLWRVVYTAKDTNGRSTESSKLYRVNETQPPQLSADTGSLKASYERGSGITIPSYSASDNSGAYTVDVYVRLPDNQLRLLLQNVSGSETSYLTSENSLYPASFRVDEHTFRAEQAGTYTLIYFAYDEYYNCTSAEATFTVR